MLDSTSSADRQGDQSRAASGFLNLYKPVGPGSQGILGRLRHLCGTRRVGHGGTLDPFASGMLPVAIGRATRLVERLHSFPKTYVAELRLGIETSTDDLEGEVTQLVEVQPYGVETIHAALARFIGVIQQVPPVYSAIKVGGRRSYDLARGGTNVELAARTVVVHSLSLREASGDRLVIEVCASSGTYVRALGRDIALALGTVGHLTRLTRVAVGPLHLDAAYTVEEVEDATQRLGLDSVLLPPDVVLEDLPAVALQAGEAVSVFNGQRLQVERVDGGVSSEATGELVRAYDDGRLLAAMENSRGGLLPRLLLR